MSSKYRRIRLEPDETRCDFDCGDPDLNEYYYSDSIKANKELIAITYAFYKDDQVIAYYCVSNDALRRDIASTEGLKRIKEDIEPEEKRYRSMPAVKIGRFAVAESEQSSGIGSRIMDGIKYDFINNNKTGCRFIIVDAYNNLKTINFYKRNGFNFLTHKGGHKETRLMYFDLMLYVNAAT